MADLLERRATDFVLWIPRQVSAGAEPQLVIGELRLGAPPTLVNERRHALKEVAGKAGLWSASPAACGLAANAVYHYWFDVEDTYPGHAQGARVAVCDPAAFATDWRITRGDQPAAMVRWDGTRLVACDGGGDDLLPAAAPSRQLDSNNQLVIYELPTAWTRMPPGGGVERGVGTFRDVAALVDAQAAGANFSGMWVTRLGSRYLVDLGVNAVELLPLADSFYEREWGYGPSHPLAPDFDLGCPDRHSWPTANDDLRRLVDTLHEHGIRVIVDTVLGFARTGAYQHLAFEALHLTFDERNPPRDDPDAWSSRWNEARKGWGGCLFRYVRAATSYDPVTGQVREHVPARQLMFTALERWMRDFRPDGLRLDSVETVANWDFVRDFRDRAHEQFANLSGLGPAAGARFLVIGEELAMPLELLEQRRVDAMWNERCRSHLRPALLGRNAEGEPSFEWTVRKAVDCRLHGFTDCAQAINYFGSHDVEGKEKERLATFFRYAGLDDAEVSRRMKLAFACLLTSVGIPMFLAGDEFADENDVFDRHGNVTHQSGKQVDPVNFGRLEWSGWRRDLLTYVSRLVHLRRSHPALGRNEIDFFHVDFTPGRRVVCWKRGLDPDPVVVVANFSDFESGGPGTEYVVPGWPTVSGARWREVTQDGPDGRPVPAARIGREPLYRWEAKVYVAR